MPQFIGYLKCQTLRTKALPIIITILHCTQECRAWRLLILCGPISALLWFQWIHNPFLTNGCPNMSQPSPALIVYISLLFIAFLLDRPKASAGQQYDTALLKGTHFEYTGNNPTELYWRGVNFEFRANNPTQFCLRSTRFESRSNN
jgi:hypothetical protein